MVSCTATGGQQDSTRHYTEFTSAHWNTAQYLFFCWNYLIKQYAQHTQWYQVTLQQDADVVAANGPFWRGLICCYWWTNSCPKFLNARQE